jgi:hypothetical protein
MNESKLSNHHHIVPVRENLLFGLLCLFALAVRLLLLLHEDYLEDDTYITLRFAENIAHGLGYAFNAHEQVYGASSPLYTLLMSGFAVLIPRDLLHHVALGWGMVSIVAVAFVIWKWFPLNSVGRFIATVGVLAYPRVLYSSISGMEECFLLFLMCLSFAACVHRSEVLAGIVLGALILAKLDTIVWVACIVVACTIQLRRVPFRMILIALCSASPWVLFSMFSFGSIVPHSVLAKQVAFPYKNLHITDVFAAMAPEGLNQNTEVVFGFGAVISIIILLAAIKARKTSNFLHLALPMYCVAYSILLLTSHTSPTLWSRWLVPSWGSLIISAGYVLDFKVARLSVRPMLQYAFWSCIAFGMFALPFLRSRSANESIPYREVASWLQENSESSESIMLEPIGLIPYYSNLYVHDFVGLVTPAVTHARRVAGYSNRWYARYLQEHKPTYVLLRTSEFRQNDFGYGSGYGDGIFTAMERKWFEQTYSIVFVSSRPELQNTFVLFKQNATIVNVFSNHVRGTGR